MNRRPRRLNWLILIALGLVLLMRHVSAAGWKDQVLSARPHPLLEGRLYVRMPVSSVDEPRATGIMSAFTSSNEETRLVFDDGEKRLVLMAMEYFATAGDDFLAAAHREIPDWIRDGAGPGILSDERVNGMQAVRFKTRKLVFPSPGSLLEGMFLVHPDGTVLILVVYVDQAAAEDAAGCYDLAHRILSSVSAGPRFLYMQGGTVHLDFFDEERLVRARIPRGYTLTTRYGVDFVLHRLRKIKPFSEGPALLTIYLGGHPGTKLRRSRCSLWRAGKMLQAFHAWKPDEAEGGFQCLESLAYIPDEEWGLFIHLYAYTEQSRDFKELVAIGDSLFLNRTWPILGWRQWLPPIGLLGLCGIGTVLFAWRRRRKVGR